MKESKINLYFNANFIIKALGFAFVGFFSIQFFLNMFIQICPSCFVHIGDDIYCITSEGGEIMHEKNPLTCEDGVWADSIQNTTVNVSDETWKRLRS